MILLDTSVLIDYFKGEYSHKVQLFDEIIENNVAFGICPFVYQEILQGAKTQKEFDMLKAYLQPLPFYGLKFGRNSFEQAAILNFRCRRSGVTIRSTIDLLITQIAIENDLFLLHNDKDFDFIANTIPDLKIYDKQV